MEKNKTQRKNQRGQAMVEYVIILTALAVISAVILAEFKNVLEAYTNRIIARVQDDTK